MREIHVDEIKEAVKKLVMDTEYFLPEDFVMALKESVHKEESEVGRDYNRYNKRSC